MESVINVCDKKESILAPLVEWRVLGAQELLHLSRYGGKYRGLLRYTERLEKEGLVESFIHKIGYRKFFYLSKETYQKLTGKTSHLTDDIKMHDAILSTILFKLLKQKRVKGYKICEGSSSTDQGYVNTIGIEPDAVIQLSNKELISNVAIEVELNRKNSTNIVRKYKSYHSQSEIKSVLYFFCSQFHLDAYANYYKEFREENNIPLTDSRIFFFLCSNITDSKTDIFDSYWRKPDGTNGTLRHLIS